MKKKLLFCFLATFMLFIPFASVKGDVDETVIKAEEIVKYDESVNGSAVLAGSNVEVSGTIKGINIAAGSNVRHNATSEYAILAAVDVVVDGIIQNDGLIAGNYINFNKNFSGNRDLFVFGNSVELRGKISRNIVIYASTVIIEDTEVLGNISIHASSIDVRDNVTVIGEFGYNEDAVINFSNQDNITNIVKLDKLNYTTTLADKISNEILSYGGILVVFIALVLLVPNMFKKIEKQSEDISVFKALSLAGYGAVWLILIPLICILLFSFIIGTQLAILVIALYFAAFFYTTLFTGYLLGLVIWKKWVKKEINPLLVGLIGITIIYILQLIPYINTIVTLLNILIGLGIITSLFKRTEVEVPQKKVTKK